MSWMGRRLADFEPLWPAERKLVEEMAGGFIVQIGPELPGADPPRALRLRASFLRYLALGGCEACRPPDKGVRVQGAYVEGDGPERAETRGLDLEGCTLAANLELDRCLVPDTILLRGAKVESLFFSGSLLFGGVEGDRLETRGGVTLRDVMSGTLRLGGTRLGGDLDAAGGWFQGTPDPAGTPGEAVFADRLEVGGSLILRDAETSGQVRLGGARLGGDLDCDGCTFCAAKDAGGKSGAALFADGLEVRGDVLLRGSDAAGEIRLHGARVGGDLDCDGASFRVELDAEGAPEVAIFAEGLEVRGDAFLRDVDIAGEVRLGGAKIGGSLDGSGGSFRAEPDGRGNAGVALSADGLETGGTVFLSDAEVWGEVRLLGARVGGDCGCVRGRFRAGRGPDGWPGPAILADGLEVRGGLSLRAANVLGELRLPGAKLGQYLDCSGGRFRARRVVINADRMQVGGSAVLHSARVFGEVRLFDAEIGGHFDCSKARLRAAGSASGHPRVALLADELRTGGGVLLRDGAISGEVSLVGARLGGVLDGSGSRLRAGIRSRGGWGRALTADRLEAGAGVWLRRADASGEVRLADAKLGGSVDCADGRFRAEGSARGGSAIALSLDKVAASGVSLRGVDVRGEVGLSRARLAGDLECVGATLRGDEHTRGSSAAALAADGMETQGWVFLRDVRAWGEVRLSGAKIGRDLDCVGARLRAGSAADGGRRVALGGERLEAQGGVLLHRVRVVGEVLLVDARLGGRLTCHGAALRAEKDAAGHRSSALWADGLRVSGVELVGMVAWGEVRLIGARVGGDLTCSGSRFRAKAGAVRRPRDAALRVQRLQAQGAFILGEGAVVDGLLDLTAAEVGVLTDDRACWPAAGDLMVDRFDYGAIVGGPVDAASRLDWLDRQDPARWGGAFRPQPYQQLADVLRAAGDDDAAQTLLVARERRWRATELRRLAWWRRPAHWSFTQLLRMVGFGYRPERALIPALTVMLLGAGLVHWSAGVGVLVPARPVPAGAGVAAVPEVALVPLAYSFEAFVPIVKLGQVEAFRPDMGKRWGYWLQVYLWAHGFLGWLIGGIAVAGVLGLFRRQ